MTPKKKRLNRKTLLEKLHSIESLLLQPGLTDAQARKFGLIEVREMIDILNRTAKARGPKGISEEAASQNGGE